VIQQKFIDRKRELETLKKAYESDRKELIVIYGRRRIGKTALALKSVEGRKNYIYFFAEETLEGENLRAFRTLVAEYLNDSIMKRAEIRWEEIFQTLAERAPKTIIIIDKFPNLIKANRAIVSKFQKIWDQIRAPLKLVLLGSSVSVMESEVLSYRSALYGRRTAQIRVEPLEPIFLQEFFPKRTWEERIRIFGITDMIPAYLWEARARLEGTGDLQRIFAPNTPLFEEVEFLLRYELREPARYYEILEAIANGATKFGEICNATGMDAPTVSKYLSRLELLGIVKEEYPLLETRRKGLKRYKISDNYFRFWFRFIYPNRSTILQNGALPGFDEMYQTYMGQVFEEFWKRSVPRFIELEKVGKWWHKKEEVDVVGVKGKTVYALEVKWADLKERDAKRVLGRLEKKINREPFAKYDVMVGVLAKRVERKEDLREEGYVVLDLGDLNGLETN
jgi:AAA+ ATPase superfamily predicted ATPase